MFKVTWDVILVFIVSFVITSVLYNNTNNNQAVVEEDITTNKVAVMEEQTTPPSSLQEVIECNNKDDQNVLKTSPSPKILNDDEEKITFLSHTKPLDSSSSPFIFELPISKESRMFHNNNNQKTSNSPCIPIKKKKKGEYFWEMEQCAIVIICFSENNRSSRTTIISSYENLFMTNNESTTTTTAAKRIVESNDFPLEVVSLISQLKSSVWTELFSIQIVQLPVNNNNNNSDEDAVLTNLLLQHSSLKRFSLFFDLRRPRRRSKRTTGSPNYNFHLGQKKVPSPSFLFERLSPSIMMNFNFVTIPFVNWETPQKEDALTKNKLMIFEPRLFAVDFERILVSKIKKNLKSFVKKFLATEEQQEKEETILWERAVRFSENIYYYDNNDDEKALSTIRFATMAPYYGSSSNNNGHDDDDIFVEDKCSIPLNKISALKKERQMKNKKSKKVKALEKEMLEYVNYFY